MKRSRAPQQLEDLEGQDCLVYVRVSTKRQAKRYGIPSQLERTRRFCQAYGLRVVETYEDDRTGTNASKRERFQQLLDDLTAGRARVVVVAYVSRWARNEFDGFGTLQRIHDAAGCLVVADRALMSTDRRRFTELARELVEAGDYSRKLAETMVVTIDEHVRIREDVWGPLPYGFRRGGAHHTARPDPKTMPTAVQAYQLAAQGCADREVADRTGLTLWTVRGILRSRLYAGILPDGRRTRFAAPVDPGICEQAWSHRRTRVRIGERTQRRIYPLSGHGPAVCATCDRPVKGDTKVRRNSERVRVYRHYDGFRCAGWHVQEVPADVLEEQVAELLDGARPDRESAARIRTVLAAPPPSGPDRLAVGRVEAALRGLAAELVSRDRVRQHREILEDLERLEQERTALLASTVAPTIVHPDDALGYLEDLGRLWRETDDVGRRAMAVATFVRLGVRSDMEARTHRIVDVEVTEDAESRGLVLALPARLGVTVVGDTGFEPVTSRM